MIAKAAEKSVNRTTMINGKSIQFLDHPELGKAPYRRRLVRLAKEWSRGDVALDSRKDEADLFKALAACGHELDRLSRSRSAQAGEKVEEMLGIFDRLRSHLFDENLGLVYDMRRLVNIKTVDPSEVVSEGFWTLFKAVCSFDPWRGFRFSTYACRSILRAYRLLDTRQRKEMQKLYEWSTDSQEGDEQTERHADVDSALAIEQLRKVLVSNLAGLTATERLIINERLLRPPFSKSASLAAVGKMLSLSKERVRQIQIQALTKLRRTLECIGLPRFVMEGASPAGKETGGQDAGHDLCPHAWLAA